MEEANCKRRIAELEQRVYQLSNRVTALEAVQPHMATKGEMISSRGIFNFHFGRRKSKNPDNPHWINSDKNFAIALVAVIAFTLFLTPTVITLLQSLYACLI